MANLLLPLYTPAHYLDSKCKNKKASSIDQDSVGNVIRGKMDGTVLFYILVLQLNHLGKNYDLNAQLYIMCSKDM